MLRPGYLEFLGALFKICNVALWSTAKEHNVLSMVNALQKHAGFALAFFAIWSQKECFKCKEKILYRPSKPGVEVTFKPIAKLYMLFGCDSRRTILIDHDPFKGCVKAYIKLVTIFAKA